MARYCFGDQINIAWQMILPLVIRQAKQVWYQRIAFQLKLMCIDKIREEF
jgi:hypothetical protein